MTMIGKNSWDYTGSDNYSYTLRLPNDSESAGRGLTAEGADYSDTVFNIRSSYKPNIGFRFNLNYSSNQSFVPFGIDSTTLGSPHEKWATLYCNNLSDGTTTKTMTEVLSGTTEEWTFTLSDGTTVTKNVKLG